MMAVVEFRGIKRRFTPDRWVLDGVSFGVEKGEVVGLVGRNGAGKTTLIRIAMGMIAPQAGEVSIFDMDPRRYAVEVKGRVGYVSENQILPSFMKVGEVLALYEALYPQWDGDAARRMCEEYRLAPDTRIKTLSKGQARQVALLCAISHRPELLLLDEPAGGLDPAARRDFVETAIDFLSEAGSSILFSSHHMGDMERLATRLVMLHDGQVLLNDPIEALNEQFTMVVVPDGQETRERLRGHAECLSVRERSDGVHAVLRYPADQAAARVRETLGLEVTHATRIGLEEMFIELVGGRA